MTSSSLLLNASYHKKHEYVWFRGWGSERFLRYQAFYESKGVGHARAHKERDDTT